ncbi:uncharacterized protein [Zea mays]|uniref:Uncharacterized protein n=1 Tax=Zea mays TaxID=4577 RepID=A0A1D6LS46_MAIZE|nr:uncharacterized protein LOC118472233 [Zea mays]AQK82274.1 hypothetical protein ZEAMMB73_Zm00001d036842 [Zea mays]
MEPSLVHSQVTRYILDILSLIMDPRYVTLFIFLVLALHGDTTLAETCRQFVKVHPFCFKAMCKANCAIEGKFSDGSYVKDYRCESGGFHSVCVCILCKH